MTRKRLQKRRERRNLLSKRKRVLLTQMGLDASHTRIERMLERVRSAVERTVLRRMQRGSYARHSCLLRHRDYAGHDLRGST